MVCFSCTFCPPVVVVMTWPQSALLPSCSGGCCEASADSIGGEQLVRHGQAHQVLLGCHKLQAVAGKLRPLQRVTPPGPTERDAASQGALKMGDLLGKTAG